jgi:hypothetical protein
MCRPEVDDVPTHDSASFSAGQDAGVRVSACVARLAALQLVHEARWWNRWRRRLMAKALVACADELEETAEARRVDTAADARRMDLADDARGAEVSAGPPVLLASHRARAPHPG